MREILFRGRCENGKWVYGYYCYAQKRRGCFGQTVTDADRDKDYIITPRGESSEVIPETISQYTGITDKHGKKIFENDIITTSTGRKCLMVWFHSPQYCGWDLRPIEWEHPANKKWDLYENSNLEVIGNIYDNPELMMNLYGGEIYRD